MNVRFAGTYFDGRNLQPHPIEVAVEAGQLHFLVETTPVSHPLNMLRMSARLGDVPRFIYLPGGATIETSANDTLDALLAGRAEGRLSALIHWLERRSRVAAAATIVVAAGVVAFVHYGLPTLARRAALAVPREIERKAGQAALASIDRFLGRSALPERQKQRLTRQFLRLVRSLPPGESGTVTLQFRSMGGNSPNAFALPGGTIIVSDELVRLAESDEEIAAVLAHELGHEHHRHGLQGLLRNSSALLVVSTITGDLSTLASFSATIPFTLLQRGYSREFEQEADDFAVALLDQAKIHRGHFASILRRLQASRPATDRDFTYLSTHPNTEDRIRRINPTGEAPPSSPKMGDALGDNSVPSEAAGASATSEQPVAKLDQPPVPLSQPPPSYPFALRAAGLEGRVTVGFVVDANGDAKEPFVVQSTHEGFEAAALDAVARWKFTPARDKGHNVPCKMQVELRFQLDN